ncbi:MAG: hypothetical protein SF339_28195 [Blastocatellia bacterium]|nr:hypothetical protein [Blastocatellia bacterium]
MFSKMTSLLSLAALTLLLGTVSPLAQSRPAAVQKPASSAVEVSSIKLTPTSQGCVNAETDCVDVAWKASSSLPASELSFKMSGLMSYTEAGSSALSGNTTMPFATRQKKVAFFHSGSGGIKKVTISVMLIHTAPGQAPRQVAADTLSQTF